MSQPAGKPANGMALRGSDGSIYFIRDDVLQACRVTEKDMSEALNHLLDGQGDVAGFSTIGMPFQDSVRIAEGAPGTVTSMMTTSSTIMCPW